jgi:hypothetical protein
VLVDSKIQFYFNCSCVGPDGFAAAVAAAVVVFVVISSLSEQTY